MTTINVKGPIIRNGDKWIYDWFEEDSTCANDVINALPSDGSEVTIIINSNGGYVDCGNEIYTALKSYQGEVTVVIINACSAASVIAMAGNIVKITPVGQIMIHNVSGIARGDYHDMDKASERMQKTNHAISNAYQLKTGMDKEELLLLMDKETWLTAEEAKEMGFVDEILFEDQKEERFVASGTDMLPENVIQKMQHIKMKNQGSVDLGIAGVSWDRIQGAIEESVNRAIKESENTKKQKEPENLYSRFFF